jgi:hypothetical protein
MTQGWTLYEEDIRRYDAGDCERGYDESRAVAGWMVRMEGVFVDTRRRGIEKSVFVDPSTIQCIMSSHSHKQYVNAPNANAHN